MHSADGGPISGPDTPATDEVDRLVGDWGKVRQGVDLAPMEVLSRVSRIALLLDRARSQAFANHQIVAWEFDVLAALRRSGEPFELSPGKLLKETMVTSGTMTNRVDRLVARGMVLRSADPNDRRGVIVRLTDTGRATVDGALDGLLEAEKSLLASLDDEQRSRLAGLLRTLLLAIE